MQDFHFHNVKQAKADIINYNYFFPVEKQCKVQSLSSIILNIFPCLRLLQECFFFQILNPPLPSLKSQ